MIVIKCRQSEYVEKIEDENVFYWIGPNGFVLLIHSLFAKSPIFSLPLKGLPRPLLESMNNSARINKNSSPRPSDPMLENGWLSLH